MADEKVAWTWTAPTDGACWTGLTEYSEKTCADANKAATATIPAAGTAGKFDATTKVYVVSCKAGEFEVFTSTDAATTDDATAKTEAAAGTSKKVTFTPDKGGKTVPCTAWDTVFVKFTAEGYAKPAAAANSTNASGAKTLAAAFAAGALAVAATQF